MHKNSKIGIYIELYGKYIKKDPLAIQQTGRKLYILEFIYPFIDTKNSSLFSVRSRRSFRNSIASIEFMSDK